jgi:hypothetical protein
MELHIHSLQRTTPDYLQKIFSLLNRGYRSHFYGINETGSFTRSLQNNPIKILVYLEKWSRQNHQPYIKKNIISVNNIGLASKLSQAANLLNCVLEVPGSNFSRDTDYTELFLCPSSQRPG